MTCLTSVSFSAQLCGSIPRLAIQATRAWGFFADKKTFVIKSACIPTSMILLRAMACLMRGQIWVAVFNFDRDTVEVLNLIFFRSSYDNHWGSFYVEYFTVPSE